MSISDEKKRFQIDGPHSLRKQEGEGSEKAIQGMMFEMPLGVLVSYVRMTAQQLDALITSLDYIISSLIKIFT